MALVLPLAALSGCSLQPDEGQTATGTAAVERPGVLGPWLDAVHEADDSAAQVVVMGDSVSEGYGIDSHLERRWVDRLQAELRSRSGAQGCPTGPGGWHGTTSLVPADYRAPSLPDPVVGGRTQPATGVGPGGRALTLMPGGSVTWRVDARSVDIGYRTQFAGGPLQVSIDGQVPPHGLTVPTAAVGAGGREVWSSTDLGPGQHTVTVRNVMPVYSGQQATVTDLTPFRGDRDRCVHVLDASRSGVSARTITQTPGYVKDVVSLDPDLLLVPLGFNDRRANIPAAQFGRSLDGLIAEVRGQGYGGPILLVGWFIPGASTTGPPWVTYLDQMRQRTRHKDVSYVDLSVVLPEVTESSPYYIDALHPSAAGQPLIANSLAEVLFPRAEADAATEGG